MVARVPKANGIPVLIATKDADHPDIGVLKVIVAAK